jgi:hypothetical protein
MLDVLNTKLVLSDFGTIVVGYERLFRSILAEFGSEYNFLVTEVPSKSALQELIIAMNEIGRIGENNTEIEIKTKARYAAWTCAFVKWCLGSPPTTRSSSGKHLLEQGDSLITLTVIPQVTPRTQKKRPFDETESDLEVVPIRRVRRLKETIFREDPSTKRFAWQGMVNAKWWIQYHINILHDRFPVLQEKQELLSAAGQSIYFIVNHLPERLILCDDFRGLVASANNTNVHLATGRSRFSPQAFLSADIRVRIAKELLDGHLELVQRDCDEKKTLVPYNLAQALRDSCSHCREPGQSKMIQGTLPCKVNELLDLLATIGCTLLTLTLFGPAVDTYPMVICGSEFDSNLFHRRLMPHKKTSAITSDSWPKLVATGWQALMHGDCELLSCPPVSIFKHAAKLMGHQNISDSTIISSKYGQVLFPAFFESNSFIRNGFMQLSAFRGKLNMDNMQFDVFLDEWSEELNTDLPDAGTEELSTDEDEIGSEAAIAAHDTRFTPVHESSEGILDPESRPSANNSAENGDTGMQTREDLDLDQPDGQRTDREGSEEWAESDAMDQRIESATSTTGTDPTTGEEISVTTRHLSNSPISPVPPDFVALPQRHPQSVQSVNWRVSVHDNILRGELRLSNATKEIVAWSLIECLDRCLLTLECRHKSTCKAGEIGQEFRLEGAARMIDPHGPKTLLNVGRGYGDQLAALEMQDYFPPTIVHLDGCTKCALQLCIDQNCRTVIC